MSALSLLWFLGVTPVCIGSAIAAGDMANIYTSMKVNFVRNHLAFNYIYQRNTDIVHHAN